MFKLFGRGNDAENLAPAPHMFNISQDSMASQSQFSQFSQDFTDRFQQCNVNVAQSMAGCSGDDSMLDGNSGGGNSADGAEFGAAPLGTRLTQQSDHSGGSQTQTQTQNDLPYSLLTGSGSQPPPGSGAASSSSAAGQSFTAARPAALEIPPMGLFCNPSLTTSGTPMSALSTGTPQSSLLGGGGSVFFNSSLPLQQQTAPSKGQGQMPPPNALKSTSSSNSNSNNSMGEKERLVNLPTPMDNPFLQDENTFHALQAQLPVISASAADGSRAQVSRSRKSSRRPPQSIYVGAFRERPRYIVDFEQQELLGEGTHSVVYRARRRLDGRSYAVKKLKRKIGGEREGALLVREAMASAALQGCPSLVQYFGCWLDDGHLYVQTEDCQYGTMEPLVGALLPSEEDMAVLRACQVEMDRQAAERCEGSQNTCSLTSGQSDALSQVREQVQGHAVVTLVLLPVATCSNPVSSPHLIYISFPPAGVAAV